MPKIKDNRVALGIFDGVHLGHQKVIEKAHRVITFDPHPSFEMARINHKQTTIEYLTTLSERKALIGNLDVIHFDRKLCRKAPEEFVKDILVKRFHPTELIVGYDFRFGKDRAGDTRVLAKLGKKYGFTVVVVKPHSQKGVPIKSSVIRKLMDEGKIKPANELLGREYFVTGKVVKGFGRGAKIGFPTANVQTEAHKLIPGDGVYAGDAIVNNQLYPAAINIGSQPTFRDGRYRLEVHLIGYKGPGLKGKTMTVLFKNFLRPEQKFKSPADLKKQIQRDVQRTLKVQ